MLVELNIFRSFMYLHLGEQMPDDAPDEWFEAGNTQGIVDANEAQRFLEETEQLLDALTDLVLTDDPIAPQYQALFYDAAKATFDQDRSRIRDYFMWFYLVLFQRPEGPRWGEFVETVGVGEFVELTRSRFNGLIIS